MSNLYFRILYSYWLTTCIFHVASIILFILLLFHSYNIISDLCTKKRQSINHCEKKPSIDFNYKMLIILSFICLLFFEITVAFGALFSWTIISNPTNCSIVSKLGTICYITGKYSMYLIFIYRLYIVYKSTTYSYNTKFLLFVALINFIFCILINKFFF